ncbi:MAG: M23 family metallopeptidase [bacterium]|nr:M23 family metallopeptidase [bacterium]
MKIFPKKSYKLGRLAIILSPEGFRRVLHHNIRSSFISTFRFTKTRSGMISLSIILLIALLLFAFYPQNSENPIVEDEEKKNELLLSSQTDYSAPKKNIPLAIRTHVIQKGETLSEIAKKYAVSMDTICGSNNLTSYDLIREGARMEIPNMDGILYTMKKGNNLASIAKKYRIPIKKILSKNTIKNADFLPVGKKIFIPDARPQNIFPGYLWPVRSKVITCGYGWRRNPFNRGSKEFHQGMDIRARYERVRSTKYGKITFTGWLGGYGKTIVIAHPGGCKTLYAHLSRIFVKRGQYVKQGQYIGKSGNTGRSTGAHLHFEILKNGRHRNPYKYLKSKR